MPRASPDRDPALLDTVLVRKILMQAEEASRGWSKRVQGAHLSTNSIHPKVGLLHIQVLIYRTPFETCFVSPRNNQNIATH